MFGRETIFVATRDASGDEKVSMNLSGGPVNQVPSTAQGAPLGTGMYDETDRPDDT